MADHSTITPAMLRTARLGIGLTRPELAELAGCHHKTVQGYEAREALPDRAPARRIVAALRRKGVTFGARNVTIATAPPDSA